MNTPVPWKVETRVKRGTYSQPVKGNPIVNYITGQRPAPNHCEPIVCFIGDAANADFIVRACNAHDDLLKALHEVADGCVGYPPGHVDAHKNRTKEQIYQIAKAAIAKAEAKGEENASATTFPPPAGGRQISREID